ncbi:MAG: hypothetical protein WEE89_15540 [Gemmatimonadota bacterium]
MSNPVTDQPDEIPNPFASADVLFGFGPSWRLEQANRGKPDGSRPPSGPILSVEEMIKRLRTFIVLAALLVSSACFYESPVPIGRPVPGLRVDSTLTGVWRGAGMDGADTATIAIVSFDETYQLIHYSEPTSDSDFARFGGMFNAYFRAHPSQVGTVRFLNLEILGQTPLRYMLVRLAREGETLRVRAIKDGVADGLDTSTKLQAFLTANLENEKIYEPWMVLRRVEGTADTSSAHN